MTERPFNVLSLRTGNSARSILAEAILNRAGSGRFVAFSAGSQPKGALYPGALALLERLDHDTSPFRSKGWEEFALPDAPQLNFVFTVCDNAANQACPVWPGQPMTAHWGVPDPAAVEGCDQEIAAAFASAHLMLSNRIGLFTTLPVDALDKMSLRARLEEICASEDATA